MNSGQLKRTIGGTEATLLVVGSVVGSGILVAPAMVAPACGSTWIVLGLWLAGGLYALTGALSQSQLAVMYPQAGGGYVYLRKAYGPVLGFLDGWVSLTIGFAGSQAALALSCSQYLEKAGVLPDVEGVPLHQTTALVLIAVLTVVNLAGVKEGSLLQSVLTAVKCLGLVALGAAAFLATDSPAPTVPASAPLAGAMLVIVFTYAGWNDTIYIAGEIKRPNRNLPLSLIGGTVAVTVLYLLFNYAYMTVTGGAAPGKEVTAATHMAQTALGGGVARLVAVLSALLILGTVAAIVITGPRIAYAMAADRALPAYFSKVNKRGVPARAIIFQGLVSVLFLTVGDLRMLFEWVGLAIVVFSALTTSCVFVEYFRGNRCAYKIPFFPLPPLIYISISLAIGGWVFLDNPTAALYGVLFVLAGLPIYYLSSRNRLT